jgi:ADP-ribosyl-[dinitrogen reductase] hydrolase
MANKEKVIKDRLLGALVGLAVGDALGTTVEFREPGSFEPVADIIGGGVFNLEPGQWTDDTSMALCLAESLIEKEEFDGIDQMEKYVDWYKNGRNSVKGYCFDIGNSTINSLEWFIKNGGKYPFCPYMDHAGNGALMRLAPISIFYYGDYWDIMHMSGESSRTTHNSPQSVQSARIMGAYIQMGVDAKDKDYVTRPSLWPIPCEECPSIETYITGGLANSEPLHPAVEKFVLSQDENFEFNFKNGNATGGGYAPITLRAALWAFANTDSFKSGALKVVNLGGDADTTGAVYGQIAGAYYGLSGIPEAWVDKIWEIDRILEYGEKLYELNRKRRLEKSKTK